MKAKILDTKRLPLILWMLLMLTVNSIPGSHIPKVSLWQWDKAAHVFEYTVLAFLVVRYIRFSFTFPQKYTVLYSCLFNILFALLDEIHQIWIPFRLCTWQDLVADIIGVIAGTGLALKVYSSSKYSGNKYASF